MMANMSSNSPPFRSTEDDLGPAVKVERLEVDLIVSHLLVRGSGGRFALLY